VTTRTATRPRRTSRVPARFGAIAPLQRRGQETADRFATAAETLLRDRPFEEISIHDIVRSAGRPIGSFYARFASKEALLPYLYQRYHDDLERTFQARVDRVDWDALDFEEAVAAVVDVLLGQYVERRWLLRAMALFARARPEALPPDLVDRRRRVFDHAVRALDRHRSRIAHRDREAAIRFGIFMVSSVAREKLLFGEAPHARVTPMTARFLRDQLVRALHSYLATELPR
jgi:AcrR family transcriptional regulator